MTALEEIQQAIETLEGLRDDAGHDWRRYRQDNGMWAVGLWGDNGGYHDIPVGPEGIIQENVVVCDALPEVTDLIVTLHRTIDAQIALLSDAERALADPVPVLVNGRDLTSNLYHFHIELARAINGSAS